jgi:flagellar biosynthesis repressor protein FlbT
MALKITLKPHERLIIGGAVITNGPNRTEFVVDNNVPILRHKNILSHKDADSPARRIYFVIQLMYVDGERLSTQHQLYWELVRDFIMAAPSATEMIEEINELILKCDYYRALRTAARLIEFEQEVMQRAKQCCQSLSDGGQEHHVGTRNRSPRPHASRPQTY